jgi:catechol 2,3-dioxygenase-like lactoylglutathione lyase family enzyme
LPPNPITAVDLTVRDLDRSVDFYTRLMGLPLLQTTDGSDLSDGGDGSRRAVLSAGAVALRLREVPGAADSGWLPDDLQRGFRHVGFKVSDIDARAKALRERGVEFRMDPTDAHGGVRIAFFYDPDGVHLEFVQGQIAYDEIDDQALVDAERRLPAPDAPRFDHVALTVTDLAATTDLYRSALGFGVAGRLVRHDDPRGFLITFLRAGSTVLEVFTYALEKGDSPLRAGPVPVGLRDVAFAGDAADLVRRLEAGGTRRVDGDGLLVDPDGLPLLVEEAV